MSDKPLPHPVPEMSPGLDAQELDLCRQWFDSVQDTNPSYLKEADYTLAAKLYRQLGLRVPYSVEFLAEEGRTLEKRRPDQLRFVAETQYGFTPGKELSSVRLVPEVQYGRHEVVAAVTVEHSKQGLLDGAEYLRGMADEMDRRAAELT